MSTTRLGSLASLICVVALATSATAHAQCLSTVFTEDFEGGVLPPGWTQSGTWSIQPAMPGCVPCGDGFAVSADPFCNCGFPFNYCDGIWIESPAIALPALSQGQKLVFDFCFSAHQDGYCGSQLCNRVEIIAPTLTETHYFGTFVWTSCPSPITSPPYDISAFAGEIVKLRWSIGCVDAEGSLRLGFDKVRIYQTLVPGPDCNGNLMPDSCDIEAGVSEDCNANLVPDECDLGSGASLDCNANGTPDECDIAAGLEQDCDGDGVPDACAIATGAVPDCNGNGIPDSCDLASGTSNDFDTNNQPDECQCTNTHFYCVGGVNSLGKNGAIGYDGVTSITLNHLTMTVKDARPDQIGIFFMGSFKTQTPFGDGFLCLTGNIERLMPPVFLNSAGAGSYMMDFTDPNSPLTSIQPLSEWNLQFWYRDPQTIGNQFNLSNAVHMHFCP